MLTLRSAVVGKGEKGGREEEEEVEEEGGGDSHNGNGAGQGRPNTSTRPYALARRQTWRGLWDWLNRKRTGKVALRFSQCKQWKSERGSLCRYVLEVWKMSRGLRRIILSSSSSSSKQADA